MTRALRPYMILAALAAVGILVTANVSGGETGPFETVKVFLRGNGSPGPYRVGRTFISGSAAIDSLSAAFPIHIVESDGEAETILFDRPLPDGDSIAVFIAVPPQWLRKAYTRSIGATRARPLPPGPVEDNQGGSPGYFPGLSFSGSKTFDVNVGADRETALNQTLRLNISGKLTDDITLNAAISDQNVPIRPEGDTRELEELDRVMIELRGNNFSVDMGDTDLRHKAGRWLTYERRLSGARAAVKAHGMEVFGSGAVSEGRRMSITITPIEGNQGPYRLITETGRRIISMIPGTEKIWINGEPLVRGAHGDYTIDYSTGEVIFTEKRIVGADMRIVCDYEYTSESYLRNFYSAGFGGAWMESRLNLTAVVAREADNASKPILYDLDKTARLALAAAGDNPALLSGISPASGDSLGTYDMIDDHLVYNQLGKGKYHAEFSWVGDTKGSYRYVGGGIYEFVPPEGRGPGSGVSYDPVTVLDGPMSHDLAGAVLTFAPAPFVRVETELAGSAVDKNTISNKDDADNRGSAGRFEVRLSPVLRLGVPVKVDIAGSSRTQGDRFAPLDRDRSAEENRGWGLPLVKQSGKEAVSEYTGGVSLQEGGFAGSGLSFHTGRAEFGADALSERNGAAGNIVFGKRGEAQGSFDRIARENIQGLPDERIDRLAARTRFIAAGFTQAVIFEREMAEGTGIYSHGSSYDDIRVLLDTPEWHGFKSGTEWFYRREQAKRVSWSDSALVRGGTVSLTRSRNTSGVFSMNYSRRERNARGSITATDQAVLEYFYHPDKGSFRVDTSYRAGRTREASKRRNFIYTGGGRGSYRWEDENNDGIRDPDEFIPDEHGSYYLYEETLDDYRPVNTVSAYSRLGMDVPSLFLQKIEGAGKSLRTETTIEVGEKSTAPTSDVFLLNLGAFRRKGKTLTGDLRLQEDLTLPLADGGGSIRLRYFRYDALNAEYVTGAETRGERELSLRLRLPLNEYSDTEFSVKRAVWQRAMDERPLGDFNVRSVSGEAGVSYYPFTGAKAGIMVGGGADTDAVSSVEARYVSLKPSASYHFSGKGRLEGGYTLTSVKLAGAEDISRLPYTMAQGQKEGDNHEMTILCDYRLSQRMNLIVTYTGRKFGGEQFENFARAQVRALF